MNALSFYVVLAAMGIFSATVVAEGTSPERVQVRIERGWMPIGFDDNDQAEIIVAGELPNDCHTIGPTKVEHTNLGIEVTQYAYRYQTGCSGYAVPYSQRVDLGILKSANYTVLEGGTAKILTRTAIAVAKNTAVDDFMYAPVTSATILREATGPVLYLTGNLPSHSVRIKEIVVNTYEDSIVVQPVVEPVPPMDPLWKKLGSLTAHPRFQIRKPLKELPKGTFLLHVRAQNGKGISQLENFIIETSR
jgi:hypothetical protein